MPQDLHAGAYRYLLPSPQTDVSQWSTVIGVLRVHKIKPKETLLDIARLYGLGFNEISLLYPDWDPWIPPEGKKIIIPTKWILPETRRQGIVINIPEMRLYHFFPKIKMVKTYPVGIGVVDWKTPLGTFKVADLQTDPTWIIPKSLREEYGLAKIPPGPENPLGKYWIGLSIKGYGLHGTNFPWGVGRLVSHGCIRLYPEHIIRLFNEVKVGTPVEIVYQPVKVGFNHGEIYIEVHPDVYGLAPDLMNNAKNALKKFGLWDYISYVGLKDALEQKKGIPVRIGKLTKGGDMVRTRGIFRLPEVGEIEARIHPRKTFEGGVNDAKK
jgi:L,D-transpeptidase ErfK/SrfK